MRKFLLYGLTLFALATAPAAWAREPFYIGPSQVDLTVILAPPPAAGSTAQKDDLQAVLDAQRTRTPAQIKSAQDDVERSIFRFADVLGPEFRPEKIPFTAQFFERVLDDEDAVISGAKEHFHRDRPFVVDKHVTPVVRQPSNASYPSGHSTFAYADGILLAAMVPEKAAAIFDRAAVFARNRVIAGVHFPTDIEAGRISGSVIDNALLHDPHFLADFARAKAEVRQALNLK